MLEFKDVKQEIVNDQLASTPNDKMTKYKNVKPEQLKIIEVPDILKE